MQEMRPDIKVAIYCGPGMSAEQLCEHAATRFNLQVAPTFQVWAGRAGAGPQAPAAAPAAGPGAAVHDATVLEGVCC